MKDENDRHTADMGEALETATVVRRKRKRASKLKELPLKADRASSDAVRFKKVPDCAQVQPVGMFTAAYFVPVSFVAKDWKVTPRRVRALLASGRLVGKMKGNGYWEVQYPYLYSEGTRGPGPKRHQRPVKKGLQLVVNN